MIKKLNIKKGFTLIEIVIVLAIAALIMVIVFFAVAGAQRTRKDQQRKDLDARVVSQLENWASNHSGEFPKTVTSFQNDFWPGYMKSTQADPDGVLSYPGGISNAAVTVTVDSDGNITTDPANGSPCTDPVGTIRYGVTTTFRQKAALICLGVKQWYNPEK